MQTKYINIADTAQAYLALELFPIPLRPNAKIPATSDWPSLRLTEIEISSHFSKDANIGLLLGQAGLTDVDLDWHEAGVIAPLLLPKSWQIVRSGQLRHILFQCEDIKTTCFDAPHSLGQKRRVVEILGAGKQVMAPPSVHPDGSRVEWWIAPDQQRLTKIAPDELLSKVKDIAACSLLARLWPDLEGSRHDVTMALAGSLSHAGWEDKRIKQVVNALLTVAGDNEKKDRARAILDTLRVAKSGQPISGLPKLAEYLPGDITDCLKKGWELGEAPLILMFNGKPITFDGNNAFPEELHSQGNGEIASNVIQWPQQPQGTAGEAWTLPDAWPELLELESSEQGIHDPYPTLPMH